MHCYGCGTDLRLLQKEQATVFYINATTLLCDKCYWNRMKETTLCREVKSMDKWDRKTNFGCASCMYFVPKDELGRCRRNAPTMKGFPVVYPSDWCGEHKIGSNPIRDGQAKA